MKKLILALTITGATFSTQAYELIEYNPSITAAVGVNAFGGISGSASIGGLYVGFDKVEDTIHGFKGTADTVMVGYTFEGSDWSFTPLLGINKIKHNGSLPNQLGAADITTDIYSSDAMVGLAVSYSITKNVFIEARATHTISKHDISLTTRYTDNKGVRKSFRTSLANEHFANASLSIGYSF